MKISDVLAALHEKAEQGNTEAQVSLLMAYRMADQSQMLMQIDCVLSEIRSAMQAMS